MVSGYFGVKEKKKYDISRLHLLSNSWMLLVKCLLWFKTSGL